MKTILKENNFLIVKKHFIWVHILRNSNNHFYFKSIQQYLFLCIAVSVAHFSDGFKYYTPQLHARVCTRGGYTMKTFYSWTNALLVLFYSSLSHSLTLSQRTTFNFVLLIPRSFSLTIQFTFKENVEITSFWSLISGKCVRNDLWYNDKTFLKNIITNSGIWGTRIRMKIYGNLMIDTMNNEQN